MKRRDFLALGAAALASQAQARVGVLGRAVGKAFVPAGGGGGSQTLLAATDFSVDGYYDLQTNGTSSPASHGLTFRYVAGDLRLMVMQMDAVNGGRVDEVSLSGVSFGDTISTTTNQWTNIWAGILNAGDFASRYFSLSWNATQSLMYSSYGIAYTTDVLQGNLTYRTLTGGGGISGLHGPVGLQGVGSRLLDGTILPVPSAWQTALGIPAFCVLGGGAHSIRGNGVSLGPACFAFPDIAGYSDNTEVPSGTFKTLANFETGSVGADWYGAGVVTTFDRGRSSIVPSNYYDTTYGGSPSPPVAAPSTYPPVYWNGLAPDGYARMLDTDGFGAWVWIDTATRKGIVYIPTMSAGKCWYSSSDTHTETPCVELHVFDPATFGSVASGATLPFMSYPSSMTQITSSLTGYGSVFGGSPYGASIPLIQGGCYDPTSGKLFVCSGWAVSDKLRVWRLSHT